MSGRLLRLDARLMRVARPWRATVLALTALAMVWVSLPHVPRTFVDYARVPWLQRVEQPAEFGTDIEQEGAVLRRRHTGRRQASLGARITATTESCNRARRLEIAGLRVEHKCRLW